MAVQKVVVVFVVVLFTAFDAHGVAAESIESKLNSIQKTITQMQSEIKEVNRTIWLQLRNLTAMNDKALFLIGSALHDQNAFVSCTKYASYPSGSYMIQPTIHDAPFAGYCDQAVFGGGWLVFQYRYNGDVNFFRHWNEYRDGFGNVGGESWLGLERLYRLTKARPHELLVELKDFDGKYFYAYYDNFQIGSEPEEYVMKELGKYTGTASNAMDRCRGRTFSTVDRDTDTWADGNCASNYKGAWWYGYCADSNLNGPRRNNNGPESMYWSTTIYKPHAYSRMMIREK